MLKEYHAFLFFLSLLFVQSTFAEKTWHILNGNLSEQGGFLYYKFNDGTHRKLSFNRKGELILNAGLTPQAWINTFTDAYKQYQSLYSPVAGSLYGKNGQLYFKDQGRFVPLILGPDGLIQPARGWTVTSPEEVHNKAMALYSSLMTDSKNNPESANARKWKSVSQRLEKSERGKKLFENVRQHADSLASIPPPQRESYSPNPPTSSPRTDNTPLDKPSPPSIPQQEPPTPHLEEPRRETGRKVNPEGFTSALERFKAGSLTGGGEQISKDIITKAEMVCHSSEGNSGDYKLKFFSNEASRSQTVETNLGGATRTESKTFFQLVEENDPEDKYGEPEEKQSDPQTLGSMFGRFETEKKNEFLTAQDAKRRFQLRYEDGDRKKPVLQISNLSDDKMWVCVPAPGKAPQITEGEPKKIGVFPSIALNYPLSSTDWVENTKNSTLRFICNGSTPPADPWLQGLTLSVDERGAIQWNGSNLTPHESSLANGLVFQNEKATLVIQRQKATPNTDFDSKLVLSVKADKKSPTLHCVSQKKLTLSQVKGEKGLDLSLFDREKIPEKIANEIGSTIRWADVQKILNNKMKELTEFDKSRIKEWLEPLAKQRTRALMRQQFFLGLKPLLDKGKISSEERSKLENKISASTPDNLGYSYDEPIEPALFLQNQKLIELYNDLTTNNGNPEPLMSAMKAVVASYSDNPPNKTELQRHKNEIIYQDWANTYKKRPHVEALLEEIDIALQFLETTIPTANP